MTFAAAEAARIVARVAQTTYNVAHIAAEKKNLAGQGNIDSMQLAASLAKVKVKWAELETAQLNYLSIKFVFLDFNARAPDWNAWLEKEAVHDDWFESVEIMLGQIEVADAHLNPEVLSPAQRRARIFTQVANKEAYLTELADSLLTSLDDDTSIFSKRLLDRYGQECDQILVELIGNLFTLYSDRVEGDPVNWEEHCQSGNEFYQGINRKMQLIREKNSC